MAVSRVIPSELMRVQGAASDPAVSAWVAANAGSGKTHVLAQRVIRLLLDGVDPAKILCITFTKAAAANMANRVFDELRGWTSLDDAALAAAIQRISDIEPEPARGARARRRVGPRSKMRAGRRRSSEFPISSRSQRGARWRGGCSRPRWRPRAG